jgi:hypothetical protein
MEINILIDSWIPLVPMPIPLDLLIGVRRLIPKLSTDYYSTSTELQTKIFTDF